MSIRIPELTEEQVEYLHQVGKMLDEELSDQAGDIKEHCSEVLSHRARLTVILAKVTHKLREKEYQLLPKEGTVQEREIALKDLVKDYRFFRDIIEGQVETIDKIISFGQSILSYEKAHVQALGISET